MDLFFAKIAELAGVPEFIQILPLGDYNDGAGKPFTVTPEDVDRLIAEFALKKNDLAIDYEHLTFEKAEAPAAGWIKELINKGSEGLWARVEWTPRAAERIKSKEYRYFLPVFWAGKGKDGKAHPVELGPGALTNHPAIDGMVPLAAKKNNSQQKEHDMKEIARALGLPEDATETQIVEAAALLKNQSAQVKEVIPASVCKALDLKESASASEVEATLLAMKQKGEAGQNAEIMKMKKELSDMKAEKLVAQAMQEGKVPAVQREWALEYAGRDPAGFELFCSKAVPVVPNDKAPDGPADKKSGEPDEAALLIAKQFNNSKEDLVKYGG